MTEWETLAVLVDTLDDNGYGIQSKIFATLGQAEIFAAATLGTETRFGSTVCLAQISTRDAAGNWVLNSQMEH